MSVGVCVCDADCLCLPKNAWASVGESNTVLHQAFQVSERGQSPLFPSLVAQLSVPQNGHVVLFLSLNGSGAMQGLSPLLSSRGRCASAHLGPLQATHR